MTLCDSSRIPQARGDETTQENATMVAAGRARAGLSCQGSRRHVVKVAALTGRSIDIFLNFNFQWWWWGCTFSSWLEKLKRQHVFEISVCVMTVVTEMHYSWFINSKLTSTRFFLSISPSLKECSVLETLPGWATATSSQQVLWLDGNLFSL